MSEDTVEYDDDENEEEDDEEEEEEEEKDLDLCKNLLQAEDAQMDSPEAFNAWCLGKDYTESDCDRATAMLGPHPWTDEHIANVCAEAEEKDAVTLLQTSDPDLCKNLLQAEDAQMDTPEGFKAWCLSKESYTESDCDRATAMLGPHPWTDEHIANVCAEAEEKDAVTLL